MRRDLQLVAVCLRLGFVEEVEKVEEVESKISISCSKVLYNDPMYKHSCSHILSKL